jgi:hypothetical protein
VSSLGTHCGPCLSSSSLFGVRYSLDPSRRRVLEVSCNSRGVALEEEDDGIEEVERALHLDETIPGTSLPIMAHCVVGHRSGQQGLPSTGRSH